MKYYNGLLALSQYACEEDDSVGLGEDARVNYDFPNYCLYTRIISRWICNKSI